MYLFHNGPIDRIIHGVGRLRRGGGEEGGGGCTFSTMGRFTASFTGWVG